MQVDSRACYFCSSDLLKKEEFMIYALKNVHRSLFTDFLQRVKSITGSSPAIMEIWRKRRSEPID